MYANSQENLAYKSLTSRKDLLLRVFGLFICPVSNCPNFAYSSFQLKYYIKIESKVSERV